MKPDRSSEVNVSHTEFGHVDARRHGGQVGYFSHLSTGFQVRAQQIAQPRGSDGAVHGTYNLEMFRLFDEAALAFTRLLTFVLGGSKILIAQVGLGSSGRSVVQIRASQGGRRLQLKITQSQNRFARRHLLTFAGKNLGHGSGDFGMDQSSTNWLQHESATDERGPEGREQ